MIEQPYSAPQPSPETVPDPAPDVSPALVSATPTAAASPATASPATPSATSIRADIAGWQAALGLALILLVGAYFRFTGINWDDGQQLHPDERFIAGVAEAIRPVDNLLTYFDTANSSLNPFPYGSYTYGMFPLFLARYVGDWVGESIALPPGNRYMYIGRALSGVFDLAAVGMLFLLGARLYNRRVGLLASALYAAAVLPIQLSHYFTVDSFATIFIVAAFYVAVPAMDRGQQWHYAVFGLLTGLAMACKINTAPLAGIIVLAGVVRLVKGWRNDQNRQALVKEVVTGWLIAGGMTALAFRVFQPYAFNGPSIFGIGLNQRWLDIMREVTDQVAGKADFPPNTHWTDRPQLTYAWFQNAGWGMGLLLGIVATLGWLWAAWRIWQEASIESNAKREWQSHLLLVVWVGVYFAWQNAQFWRYMRYFMPIYPLAILLAAWCMVEVVDRLKSRQTRTIRELRQAWLLRIGSFIAMGVVLLATYGYAFAFTRIYSRPHTRVDASRWMLANLPGPLNASITAPDGQTTHQPLSIPYDLTFRPGDPPWVRDFKPVVAGTLSEFTLRFSPPDTQLQIKLTRDPEGNDIVTQGQAVLSGPAFASGSSAAVVFTSLTLSTGQPYYLHYAAQGSGKFLANGLSLGNDNEITLPLAGEIASSGADPVSGFITFTPGQDISFDRLSIGSVRVSYASEFTSVRLILSGDSEGLEKLAESEITIDLTDGRTFQAFSFAPVRLESGRSYFVSLGVTNGAPVQPSGTVLAMETSWDDSLPLRTDNYDPFGGIYRLTSLELYEADNALKANRILEVLSHSEYLVISSNRAYDAMPRLPLRYPLTLKYYQALFGCDEQLIFKCAYPAQEGLKGPLGYELVKVFESNPNLGVFEFSDQTAEEAFTVYDHPKVMIFKRTSDFSAERTAEILRGVDLTQVLEQTPAAYSAMPTALRLSPDRLGAQTNGGTWRELFNASSLLSQNQPVNVVAWYLLMLSIGIATWPIVFVVMRGLPDRGYPLAKLVGFLIITWIIWFAGSYKLLQSTRTTLWVLVAGLALLGGYVAFRNWPDLLSFAKSQRNYIFTVEALTLVLFVFFLGVRWLNPDLWHPWLGGEKPADYSFFQSALRAVYFPPYDPWLAEHYVNYYYYGYVICAVPTKLLAIAPSVAYNLVLPTLFAWAGIGAFCVAYNLVARERQERLAHASSEPNAARLEPESLATSPRLALMAGVAAMVMMIMLGNLYQARQLWQYLPEAADPPAAYSENLIENASNVFSGAWRVLARDTQLPGLPGDKGRWYFGPSRAILHDGPDTPITEFPYFSFLYADLHPHLSSMSLMLAALAWMLSLVFVASSGKAPQGDEALPPGPGAEPGLEPVSAHKRRWPWLSLESALPWAVGGLVFGALQPTQTWDFPVFILLGMFSILAAVWLQERTLSRPTVLKMAGTVALFVGLAVVMYYPFRQWFATEFTSIEIWKFTRTPLADYFTVHGLFLFIIVTFLIWEARSWVKAIPTEYVLHTPLGELLPRHKTLLTLAGVFLAILLIGTVALWAKDYVSASFASLLLIFAAILFFKPGQSLSRRAWLVTFAAGVGLTMAVEVVTLRGDLGRSNTVFKYYIEVWIFFSVAAGAALAWLWPIVFREWSQPSRRTWLTGLGLLIASAASYTIIGTYTKATDRWPGVVNPPHTLDGNAYMLGSGEMSPDGASAQSAVYDDDGTPYLLAYDYEAIRWLQDNVTGTPVVVEGMSPIPEFRLYRWGSRIAINTGLPTIVGWDHHLKQHDSILPGVYVDNRITELQGFYDTTDSDKTMRFIEKYQVEYVVIGALERKYYAAEGLRKFQLMAEQGQLELVFPAPADRLDAATYIYRVIDSGAN